MKRLAIDARLYSQTGVGTYLRNLLMYLPYFLPKDIDVTVYLHECDADKKEELTFSNIKTLSIPWHSFSEQTVLYQELMKENYDLVHFPYFGYPVLYTRPYIATIHDVTPLLFKTGKASTKNGITYAMKHAVFSHVLKSQAQNAKAIITPTKTVRDQLCALYPDISSQKIIPLYEGIDRDLLQVKSDFSQSSKIKDPYLLYVGNYYPHKNISLLLEAWAGYEISYTLVCAGPDDFFRKGIEEKAKQLRISDKIFFIKSPSREQLKGLYQNAKALIHPSLSEGFGLPIVEAMYFELPVIASAIPVFQELLDTTYFSFSPDSPQSVYDAIHMWEEKNGKVDYSTRLSLFSFEKMAQETAKLYTSVLL